MKTLAQISKMIEALPSPSLRHLVGEITGEDIRNWLGSLCWGPESEMIARRAIAAKRIFERQDMEPEIFQVIRDFKSRMISTAVAMGPVVQQAASEITSAVNSFARQLEGIDLSSLREELPPSHISCPSYVIGAIAARYNLSLQETRERFNCYARYESWRASYRRLMREQVPSDWGLRDPEVQQVEFNIPSSNQVRVALGEQEISVDVLNQRIARINMYERMCVLTPHEAHVERVRLRNEFNAAIAEVRRQMISASQIPERFWTSEAPSEDSDDSGLAAARTISEAIAYNTEQLSIQYNHLAISHSGQGSIQPFGTEVVATDSELAQKLADEYEKVNICSGCKHYHGFVYGRERLLCGMHPYGPEGKECSDRETRAMEIKVGNRYKLQGTNQNPIGSWLTDEEVTVVASFDQEQWICTLVNPIPDMFQPLARRNNLPFDQIIVYSENLK